MAVQLCSIIFIESTSRCLAFSWLVTKPLLCNPPEEGMQLVHEQSGHGFFPHGILNVKKKPVLSQKDTRVHARENPTPLECWGAGVGGGSFI